MITKLISGGQTGADRGGLDAAIHCGLPHGGWCPKGRKAEDGVIPVEYHLHEISTFRSSQKGLLKFLFSSAVFASTI